MEKVTDGLALHSTQGPHTPKHTNLTQSYHVSPSMSTPGCPYDNAAMENFFGTLKRNVWPRLSRAPESLPSIHFYNLSVFPLKNESLTPKFKDPETA